MIIGNRKYRKLSASETIEANDVYARSNEPQCVHIDQVGHIIPTNSDYDYYRPIGFKFERKLASDEILVASDEYRRIETNGHVKVERVAPGLIGKPLKPIKHITNFSRLVQVSNRIRNQSVIILCRNTFTNTGL